MSWFAEDLIYLFRSQRLHVNAKYKPAIDPLFTYMGLDVFGPWPVAVRKTQGRHTESKRWAVTFTCMATGEIYLEVIKSMTALCFINFLCRLFAFRVLRSDCGTNFVIACKELQIDKQLCQNININCCLNWLRTINYTNTNNAAQTENLSPTSNTWLI